jgi:hypothetical protein
MTEAQWLGVDHSLEMLVCLTEHPAWASVRKQRLFACACCRHMFQQYPPETHPDKRDVASRAALVAAERFADGELSQAELKASWDKITQEWVSELATANATHPVFRPNSVRHAAEQAAHAIGEYLGFQSGVSDQESETVYGFRAEQYLAQANLLRDIFGNPFRPVAFSPSWRTDTALSLAKQMYDSRDFGAMPILADALQDAGCDSEDILSHCRQVNGVHVRGCWVVDVVLDKE